MDPKPRKLPPRCRHAHSFRILSCQWNSASQPSGPLFLSLCCSKYLSKHLTHWKLHSIALEPEILWNRWTTEHFASTFSLVMPFSDESEQTKLMTSLIINLQLAVFYGQSLSCEVVNESQGGFNSSNSDYFPRRLCPPCSISNGRLLFF